MPTHTGQSFKDLVASLINSYANPIISLLIGVALVVFFYGIVKYMYAVSNEKDLKKGRELMLWGIVALFVMVSFWGIVALLQNTFFGTSAPESAPNYYAPQNSNSPLPQNQNLQGSFPGDTPNFPESASA